MFYIGYHCSAAKGYAAMAGQAVDIGANTFQFFTRNPRGGRAKAVNPDDISECVEIMKENNFGKIVAHAPYTLNACSSKESIREFAFEVMSDDLTRMQMIPGNYYNFHPGSHTGQGIDVGISLICEILNKVLREDQKTVVLLETMSGKGSEVGGKFRELKKIMDGVHLKDKLGVCLDTCHVHDAGYDIAGNLDAVLDEFDKILGLSNLKAIHLNDSKNPLGSAKDRHEKLGMGDLGLDAISNIINNPRIKDLPFILETPNEVPGYAKEISVLKELRK